VLDVSKRTITMFSHFFGHGDDLMDILEHKDMKFFPQIAFAGSYAFVASLEIAQLESESSASEPESLQDPIERVPDFYAKIDMIDFQA
jgi:hypothetical protein